MRVLLPIAGDDRFFRKEDYPFPKPLIEIDGQSMLSWATKGLLELPGLERIVVIAPQADALRYSYPEILSMLTGGRSTVLPLPAPTQGAACSCLLAIEHIDLDGPLVIANGDQHIDADLGAIIAGFEQAGYDAAVVTFEALHPRWSYVATDAEGRVVEAAEKRVISREAIAGLYYFARGRDFVDAATAMILQDQAVNGAFYLSPCLNQMILQARSVGRHRIPASRYHSFYSPAKVAEFEAVRQERRLGGRLAAPALRPAPPPVHVVIPAAGLGSRFAQAGYASPKPFIDVAGQPMIERVLENLRLPDARYVVLVREAHLDQAAATLEGLRQRWPLEVVPVSRLTEGTACTVLLARRHIPEDAPLLIANSDQLVEFDIRHFVADCRNRRLDGSILVFRDAERNPKWSFARLGEDGLVAEVAEKRPISELATVGIYLFSTAGLFLRSALDMIALNERVNNEFYTCPSYNHALRAGARIGAFEVPAAAMHGLGTPEDLKRYLSRRPAR